jgi:membrane fusion protein (multidrug efflux system)
MKKIIILSSIAVIFFLIGFRLVRNKQTINEQNKPVDRSAFRIPVTVADAVEEQVEGTFVLPAVLKPVSEVKIALNASGKLKALDVELGSRVARGQVIGSLDNSLKQINLEAAQLLVDKSRQDYERIRDLYEGKAATEVDLNNSKYNYENAKSQAAQIRQQITDASLITPVSGVVTAKKAEVGEFVNMGTPVVTVVDVSTLKAVVMVSERDVYRLKESMPVVITSDIFPGREFAGKVRFISPNGDDSHNYEVEVNVENDQRLALKAGTFIRVRFDIKGESKTLQIPKLALAEGMKNPYVYLARGDRPEMKQVVLGRDLGSRVEVLEGLKAGDPVITSGQINLTENSLIEVINRSNQQ